ncbi:tripartite tricarboxylate transporter substrate binding protein [Ramlibacter rhizophilus]|uniref:Tripartite tricarboxylate transporter substrate binding protein n=2 Tax=Ramlibacter rhizophilus TaxID=1781167 RepID=A0A4Z0BFR8_9BURK|nr:tripartite tricarboxylate transporter substrate binding protein [Ramlibacter rhizophilus]
MRQVAEEFKKNTGQPIVVDNKPGGGGAVAANSVANAAPDGYTLLMTNSSMLSINPHTYSKLSYDPDGFKPVGGFLGASLAMAVNADKVPANNLREFVAWAKSQPKGSVSYASFTPGGSSHFAGVILNRQTGMDMLHVPFNGTPPAVQNLLGGQVHAAFLPLLAVKPHVEAGRVKIIAISSPQRSALVPQVATFTEQGVPELEIYVWSGLAVPGATPEAVVKQLNTEFNKVIGSPGIRDKWRPLDFEPMAMSPAEFDKYVKADSKRWGEAVKLSGFKAAE